MFITDRRQAIGLVVAIALCGLVAMRGLPRGTELLGTWEVPTGIGIDREPYSAPPTLWLYWGSTTNRRMEGSGENVRHIFKLGTIQGGEYRDPQVPFQQHARQPSMRSRLLPIAER